MAGAMGAPLVLPARKHAARAKSVPRSRAIPGRAALPPH